jgi:hypothetical protein
MSNKKEIIAKLDGYGALRSEKVHFFTPQNSTNPPTLKRFLIKDLISHITSYTTRLISCITDYASGNLHLDPYFWFTLLLSLPVIGPLLQPGYFWGGHDARHSVYFLHQFDKVIRDGVWYPRWIPDMAFGYGYPFFNVYGPLSSYAGEVFHLAGLDIVTSVKIIFGLSAISLTCTCGLTWPNLWPLSLCRSSCGVSTSQLSGLVSRPCSGQRWLTPPLCSPIPYQPLF